MRHYVLTRSAYGSAWDKPANLRRLAITRAVTARLMSQQTTTDWTWIVLLDERDPFLMQRMKVFEDAAPVFRPIISLRPLEQLRNGLALARQRSAAADYKVAWRSGIAPDDKLLMTRIDDDDGFTVDALERYQRAAVDITKRTALMFPMGVRIWSGRFSITRHETNAMHTLITPPGDEMCVYDYAHTMVRQTVPVVTVDGSPAWLWVRHADTISGAKQAQIRGRENAPLSSITPAIKELFPIDWTAMFAAWR